MWGWESLLLQVEESKDCIERRTECRRVKLELPGGNEWTGDWLVYMELFLTGPVGSIRVGSCKDLLFSLRNKIKNKVTGPK